MDFIALSCKTCSSCDNLPSYNKKYITMNFKNITGAKHPINAKCSKMPQRMHSKFRHLTQPHQACNKLQKVNKDQTSQLQTHPSIHEAKSCESKRRQEGIPILIQRGYECGLLPEEVGPNAPCIRGAGSSQIVLVSEQVLASGHTASLSNRKNERNNFDLVLTNKDCNQQQIKRQFSRMQGEERAKQHRDVGQCCTCR